MNRTCLTVQPLESPADPPLVLALSFDTLCAHTVRCTAEKAHGAPVLTYAQPDEVTVMGFLNIGSGWRLVIGLTS
jgi:hypothetical protein